jgi:hypothetical protein
VLLQKMKTVLLRSFVRWAKTHPTKLDSRFRGNDRETIV